MSLYTLKHLLHDCSTRLTRTKCAADKKQETLEDIWRALNHWIDSRFDQGKGVHIATFATISWEVCTNSRNQTKLRPVFLLSDTFIKTYGLQQKKILTPPQLASLEDINFTKIAIKFSKSLTKDLVFCGVRDMLQKIGEVAGTGAPISIAFNVGRLIAKNRCITMIFDPLKFPRALEDEITRSMIGSPPSALGNLTDFDIPIEDQIDFNSRRSDQSPRYRDALDEHAFPSDEAMPTSRGNPDNIIQFESSLEEELQLAGIKGSPGKGNPVVESAYKRHLANLANEIDREAKYAFELQLQQKRDLDTVALEAQMRRMCAEDLQRQIKSQMEEQQLLRAREKNELKATDPAASSIFADSEQTRLGYDDKGFKRQTKQDLKESLKEQMQQKERERVSSRQRHLADDKQFLDRLRTEMDAIETKQAQDKDERRRVLTEAWTRDSTMKKMVETKKKQRAAEQIHQEGVAISPRRGNYYPGLAQPMTPRRFETMDTSSRTHRDDDDYSVGFDIRSVAGD